MPRSTPPPGPTSRWATPAAPRAHAPQSIRDAADLHAGRSAAHASTPTAVPPRTVLDRRPRRDPRTRREAVTAGFPRPASPR